MRENKKFWVTAIVILVGWLVIAFYVRNESVKQASSGGPSTSTVYYGVIEKDKEEPPRVELPVRNYERPLPHRKSSVRRPEQLEVLHDRNTGTSERDGVQSNTNNSNSGRVPQPEHVVVETPKAAPVVKEQKRVVEHYAGGQHPQEETPDCAGQRNLNFGPCPGFHGASRNESPSGDGSSPAGDSGAGNSGAASSGTSGGTGSGSGTGAGASGGGEDAH